MVLGERSVGFCACQPQGPESSMDTHSCAVAVGTPSGKPDGTAAVCVSDPDVLLGIFLEDVSTE